MGDPAGVGPELCLRLLDNDAVSQSCQPIVFGDRQALSRVANQLNLPWPPRVVSLNEWQDAGPSKQPTIVDIGGLAAEHLVPGKVNRYTGQASFEYIERAIESALAGTVDAVVTGPINKEAWQSAGIQFPGHTELFADRAQTDRFCMMMTAPSFSCSLVTTHVGYSEVAGMLESDRILEVIQLTHDALQRICGRDPKLLVMGLNPHAGEGGLFGNQEEERIIAPAIAQAKLQGIDIEGPVPPDTAFLPWHREATDGYICMYHDQGLIPFKALNFDTGVNITLGLPLIRTSVDHGTALDIAWQGKADVSSLISAVTLATKLAQDKQLPDVKTS
ncbi:MAG: 4-hydroxythreonine-4-phosphate dehydrogenase [Mariniblastus sp.]|jgi:4-hydroxythreonine-4-phosphate dehydrogenase